MSKKHQRHSLKNACTATHKNVTLITVKCNIPELLLNMRRSCSSTTPLPAPSRLNLHFFISIPNEPYCILSVYLTWPGPENFHVFIPELSPAQKLSHIQYIPHSAESGEGGRRRRRRRGQLPTEVNSVTHSDCGYEHVSRQK